MSLSKRLFIEEAAGGWDVSGLSLSSSIDAEAEGYLSTSGDAGMAFDINADGDRIAIWGYTEGLDYGFGDISTSWDLSTITNYSKQNTGDVNYRVPWVLDGQMMGIIFMLISRNILLMPVI